MAREGLITIETGTFDRQVVGNIISYKQYDVTDIVSGYTPAQWDVLALDPADSKLKKYDATDNTHIVKGIVLNYDASYTDADFQIIEKAEDVDLDSLGISNISGYEEVAARALREMGILIL